MEALKNKIENLEKKLEESQPTKNSVNFSQKLNLSLNANQPMLTSGIVGNTDGLLNNTSKTDFGDFRPF